MNLQKIVIQIFRSILNSVNYEKVLVWEEFGVGQKTFAQRLF